MASGDADTGAAAYRARWEERTRSLRENPRRIALLNKAMGLLKVLFYGAYALLLALVAWHDPWRTVPLVAVPGLGFVLVSFARARLNAPRPAERCGLVPLIDREGKGRSFPSRHTFSAFTIATCWFAESVPAALGLLLCAGIVAALRVRGGVHFPRDVAAGALTGLAVGALAVAGALLVP